MSHERRLSSCGGRSNTMRKQTWGALALLSITLLLAGCGTQLSQRAEEPYSSSPEVVELNSGQVEAIVSEALSIGQASGMLTAENVTVDAEGALAVYAPDGTLGIAYIPLADDRALLWVYQSGTDPIIVLADSPQSAADSWWAHNLTTGDSVDLAGVDLTRPTGSEKEALIMFMGLPSGTSCSVAEAATQLTPAALDPVCYDDCMRGAEASCFGACALTLLIPVTGPVAYVACVAACMSSWHATCTIGCDTNTM